MRAVMRELPSGKTFFGFNLKENMGYNADNNTPELVSKDLNTLATAAVALLAAIPVADPAVTDVAVLAAYVALGTALEATTSYVGS